MSKSNYDIAHDFAYGYESGRSCNMFIDGDCIYSYGYHFCIAKRVSPGVILFTTRTYSKSTAKHVAYTWRATSHMRRIECYDPTASHSENQKHFLSEIRELLPYLAKARKPEKYLREIQVICERAKTYCEFFKIKMDKDLKQFVESEDLNKTNEKYEATVALRAKRERRAELKKRTEALMKWHNFETNYAPCWLDYQELRLDTNKNRIETTMAVKIPFELGREFYEKIRSGELKVGDQLLFYRVGWIDAEEIHVGCHRFKRKYLLDFGAQCFS